jgi:hypothetical protein
MAHVSVASQVFEGHAAEHDDFLLIITIGYGTG